MPSERRSAHVVLGLGLVLTVLSVAWWWLIFSKVLDGEYISFGQATTCLVGSSALCTLAQALCTNQHLYGIRWYAPEAFWAAGAVLLIGLALTRRTSGPAAG